MVKIVFVLLILHTLYADSFITPDEYAKMLYKNPRGIGCHHCHGIDGKGKDIGTYVNKSTIVKLHAPNITNMRYEIFYQALKRKKFRFMPRYFLTDKEIKTLYNYLNKRKSK